MPCSVATAPLAGRILAPVALASIRDTRDAGNPNGFAGMVLDGTVAAWFRPDVLNSLSSGALARASFGSRRDEHVDGASKSEREGKSEESGLHRPISLSIRTSG